MKRTRSCVPFVREAHAPDRGRAPELSSLHLYKQTSRRPRWLELQGLDCYQSVQMLG